MRTLEKAGHDANLLGQTPLVVRTKKVRAMNEPLPLILQIQAAALDGNASVTDALRKAKIACAKLGLAEFEAWVDLELGGYATTTIERLPPYRKVRGTPEAFNPYSNGWKPIRFESEGVSESYSTAPIGMTIDAVERSTKTGSAAFEFPYPPEIQQTIIRALNLPVAGLRLKLETHHATDIVNAVRNILLEWTLKLEKEGVRGEGLVFSQNDREKSATATSSVVATHIHIGQVATFVQHAANSTVQGTFNAQASIEQVRSIVRQADALMAQLPDDAQREIGPVIGDLKAELSGQRRLPILTRGLGVLRRVAEGVTGNVVAAGLVSLISKTLGSP